MKRILQNVLAVCAVVTVICTSFGATYAGNTSAGSAVASYSNVSNYTLTIKKNFLKKDTWTYNIKGTVPNSCYKASALVTNSNSIGEVDDLMYTSDPSQVYIRLFLVKQSGTCAEILSQVDLKGEFSAKANDKLGFLVVKLDESAKEVELKNGFVYTNTTDGFTVKSTYVKNRNTSGMWNYTVTGKVSSCYDIAVSTGKSSLADASNSNPNSVVNSNESYFNGQYFITLRPKAELLSSNKCGMRDTEVNVKGTVEISTQKNIKSQSRVRSVERGVLKNNTKMNISWVN
jgi:hypothetical protein